MTSGNIFDSIPDKLDKEFFETLIQANGIQIERIISRGQASPARGWYDQETNEWVIVLQGEAVISYDNGDDVRLIPGSHINIPAHTKHRVSWTAPDTDTVWLAVHY